MSRKRRTVCSLGTLIPRASTPAYVERPFRLIRLSSSTQDEAPTHIVRGTMFVEWELARYDGVPRGWPIPDPDEPADVLTVGLRCVRLHG